MVSSGSPPSSATGRPLFLILYLTLIVFFAFLLYRDRVQPDGDSADNLKKHGGFIPGIRPGERTGGIYRLCAGRDHGDRCDLSWQSSA